MRHGKKIPLADAKKNIRKFVDDEIKRSGKHERDLVVGHRISLTLMKKFMEDIDLLIAEDAKIDSVRIYYAKSKRLTVTDDYDVVIVPVLTDGSDYYHVYDKPGSTRVSAAASVAALASATTTTSSVIGSSTPCPNVCSITTASVVSAISATP
ncbi:MAG TPA: hypothetical protein VIM65_06245 [Cyclobacteriaceae bacterium]